MKKIFLVLSSCTSFLFAQFPSYSWHASMGGYFSDEARSIVVDASGNTYVAGVFSGTVDFDPGTGTHEIQSNGGFDFYVLKLDPNGNLLWVKDFGSNSSVYDEEANDLAMDANNNIYITGSFRGQIDFDPGPAVFNMSAGGGLGYGTEELFILKLTGNGDFVWARCPGSNNNNVGYSIAVDNGHVYTTGSFAADTDLDMGPGTFMANHVDGNDIFLMKMDTTGNFVWGAAIGADQDQEARGIAVYSGDVFITGEFMDTVDFDPGPGTSTLSSNGGFSYDNAFICKFNSGGGLTWAKQIGNNMYSNVNGFNLAIDNTGNIYLTGNHQGAVDFDPGAGTQMDTTFNKSIYALKLNNSGTLLWYKSLQAYTNSSVNTGYSIALDATDNVFLTGTFTDSIDLDPGTGIDKKICIGGSDIFMVKLNASGNYIWGERLGGNNSSYDPDAGYDLKIVGNEIYFAGTYTDIIDCDPGSGTVTATSNGWNDMLIEKFGQNNTSLDNVNDNQVSLLVYPNPVQSDVYLQIDGLYFSANIHIELLDITGKTVLHKNAVANPGKNTFIISMESLTDGMYIVKMSVGNRYYTQRLIKS